MPQNAIFKRGEVVFGKPLYLKVDRAIPHSKGLYCNHTVLDKQFLTVFHMSMVPQNFKIKALKINLRLNSNNHSLTGNYEIVFQNYSKHTPQENIEYN